MAAIADATGIRVSGPMYMEVSLLWLKTWMEMKGRPVCGDQIGGCPVGSKQIRGPAKR